MKGEMKSESWLIIQFGLILMILTIISFFRIPAYEKGVWAGMTVFTAALTGLLGYKFGRSMPQQTGDAKPGQTTKSETTISTIPVPPPEPLVPETPPLSKV